MKILAIIFKKTNIFDPKRAMKIKSSGDYLFPDRFYFHSCYGFNAEQPSLAPAELRKEEYVF